jgi:serine/threonine protein kinase
MQVVMKLPRYFLDGYQVLDVKVGGMGQVFICKDLHSNKKVAIKQLREDLLANENARRRFIRECHVWIMLGKFINIVEAKRIHLWQFNQPLLVLEYVNSTLRDRLNSGTIETSLALKFAIEICDAMNYTTMRIPAFVHRDLKPENILINPNNVAKVSDFGLAHIKEELISAKPELFRGNNLQGKDKPENEKYRLTQFNDLLGTPYYMAPEQIIRSYEITTQSDIYAVGCIVYEMLTGDLLFGRKRANDYLESHLKEIPVKPSKHKQDISKGIDEIILTCLEKDPKSRYPDFQTLRKAFAFEMQKSFNQIIEVPPIPSYDPERLLSAMQGLRKMGALEDALKIYNTLESVGYDSSISPLVKCEFAHLKMKLGQLDVAIPILEEARQIEINGMNRSIVLGVILETLSHIYQQKGCFNQSIECLQEAVRLLPDVASFRYNLGMSYRGLGRSQEAVIAFQKACEIAPEPLNFVALANTLSHDIRDWKGSMYILQQAISIAPSIPDLYSECARSLIIGFSERLKATGGITPDIVSMVRSAAMYVQKAKSLGYPKTKSEEMEGTIKSILTLIESIQ